MKKKMIGFLLVALALSPGMILADRSVDETRDVSPGAMVEIENILGSIEVIGWDKDQIQITGTIGDDVEELVFERDGDEVEISVEIPDGNNDDVESHLTIRVPRESHLEIETVAAGVDVEGVTGSVSVECIAAEINVQGSFREAEVETVSGNITFINDGDLEEGEFSAVSGSIEVRTGLSTSADLEVETVSGTVDIYLPAGVSAEFEAQTFSGDIRNDFGGEPESSSFLPSKSLSFSTGSGNAQISVETFSGTIRFHED